MRPSQTAAVPRPRAFLVASILFLALAALSACGLGTEDDPKQAAEAAFARGDRQAVLDAIEDLESQADTPENRIAVADLMIQAGEGPEAVWRLEAALERWPERDDLRVALARSALLVANASRALQALAPIAPESEEHAAALLLRGQAELALGDLDAALATFEETATRYPDSTARWHTVVTLVRENRPADARGALEAQRGAELSEEGKGAFRVIDIWLSGIEARDAKTRDAGLARLEALVQEDPGDPVGWDGWIAALQDAGQSARARDLLRDAVAEDPGRSDLQLRLARLESAFGDYEAAAAILEAVLEKSPVAQVFVSLASVHAAAGDSDAAFATFDRALEALPEDPGLHRSRIEALIDAGKLKQARDAVAAFQARMPDSPHVEFVRARLSLAEGHAAAAHRRLLAIVATLDDSSTQFWLGRALEAMGDEEGAARRYSLAFVRSQRDPAIHAAVLSLAERRGDLRVAATSAAYLTRLRPTAPEGWISLARMYEALGEFEFAEKIAREAVRRFPERADAAAVLALVLRLQGKTDAALAVLDAAAVGIEGVQPELAAERAMALGVTGRIDEALAVVDDASAAHPDSAALYHARGALLFQAGRVDEGSAALGRAFELAPDDPSPFMRRARYRAVTGDLDGARSDLERYVAARPLDPQGHLLIGMVEEQAGRPSEAIAAYRKAADVDDRAWGARNNLAGVLAARGDMDGALAAAQEAYAIAGDDPNVLDTLGWLYLQKGLVERSIGLLERSRAAAPQLDEPALHLALAYGRAGRSDEARRLLADLQAREPSDPALRAQVAEALDALP